ncbi:MAG: type II TA system antitoxin MqsA family protein [Bacillota bacterium]
MPDDKGRQLKWWVFGPSFCGIRLYIKLTITNGKVPPGSSTIPFPKAKEAFEVANSLFCPNCISERPVQYETRAQTLLVREEPIQIQAKIARCTVCGTELFDMQAEEQNLKTAYYIYRAKRGFLTPEAIRAIRERYGFSQRALARALNWSVVTIHRYEKGALQDAAHDALLRKVGQDPLFLLEKLEENKCRFSPKEWESLRAKITAQATASTESALITAFERTQAASYGVDPALHGFRRFDLHHVATIVLWLAQRVPTLFKTKLAKLLWIADFAHFAKYRASLTGLAYRRLPYGPMPDKFHLLLSLLEESGYVALVPKDSEEWSGDIIVPTTVPDLAELSQTELEVLGKLVDRFGALTATQLSELSHSENVWMVRETGEVIPYLDADSVEIVRRFWAE